MEAEVEVVKRFSGDKPVFTQAQVYRALIEFVSNLRSQGLPPASEFTPTYQVNDISRGGDPLAGYLHFGFRRTAEPARGKGEEAL